MSTALRTLQKKLRIGHVVLVGSDLDRQVAAKYARRWLSGGSPTRQYLRVEPGQGSRNVAISDAAQTAGRDVGAKAAMDNRASPNTCMSAKRTLSIIYVTAAEGATTGNGHAYFRDSPWVSSDILMTLAYDLPPNDRGLVRNDEDTPIWAFPPDYIDRLRVALIKANPEYGRALSEIGE